MGDKPKTSVSFGSVKVGKGGSMTVSGSIKPGAVKSGATIEVLAMKTAGGPPKFGEKTTVKVGQRQDELHREVQAQARDTAGSCAWSTSRADSPRATRSSGRSTSSRPRCARRSHIASCHRRPGTSPGRRFALTLAGVLAAAACSAAAAERARRSDGGQRHDLSLGRRGASATRRSGLQALTRARPTPDPTRSTCIRAASPSS